MLKVIDLKFDLEKAKLRYLPDVFLVRYLEDGEENSKLISVPDLEDWAEQADTLEVIGDLFDGEHRQTYYKFTFEDWFLYAMDCNDLTEYLNYKNK